MKNFRYLPDAAILELDQERCIGCGLCTVVCPHGVFQLAGGKATLYDRDGCMECRACAKNCPVEAILVNPQDGCGCAALLIKSWLARATGRDLGGGCC